MPRTVALALSLLVTITVASGCRRAESQVAASSAAAEQGNSFTGTVAETMNAGGYTYVRLQASGREDVWLAASEFATKPGDRLSAALDMPMKNFESKALNRTFPVVYFVESVTRDGEVVAGAALKEAPAGGDPGPGAPSMMSGHGAPKGPVTVTPNDPPAGGLSIANVWEQRKALNGKEVTVRGTVVKVNTQIMGTNWIHLQDGSGSETDRTHDLTITTDAEVNRGDVVTVTGILTAGKDFGSGYAYDAIIEKGRVVR